MKYAQKLGKKPTTLQGLSGALGPGRWLSGPLATRISESDREYIYNRYSQFTGTFVANAPGFLTENINPLRGISNGTPISYHSLSLDPKDDDHRILSCIQDNLGNIQPNIISRYIKTSSLYIVISLK